MKLFRLFRLFYTVLSRIFGLFYTAAFGPRLPNVQVDYCSESDHMIVLIGDGMPTVAQAMNQQNLPNGVMARFELWASNKDLREIIVRVNSGLSLGRGLCQMVYAAGAEGERIAQMMRQNPAYAYLVHLAVLYRVRKFRARPGFAERSLYWRSVREPQQQMLGAVRRFAPGGIDDGNAVLFVIIETGNGETDGVSLMLVEHEH